MFRNREYKSGSGWAFWRWTFTPSGYITRLHVIKAPFGAIMIHFINTADPEPHIHDHPVTFLSLILTGGYEELRMLPKYAPVRIYRKRRFFNFIRANARDAHTITSVLPGTVTLCIVGPKTRDWGFHTEDGWVFWKDYNKKYRKSA